MLSSREKFLLFVSTYALGHNDDYRPDSIIARARVMPGRIYDGVEEKVAFEFVAYHTGNPDAPPWLTTDVHLALDEGVEPIDSEYDDEMPKVEPAAKRIKEFMLGDNFQAEFDAWAAEVEKEHGGSLEITHEEIIHDGVKILIFWRIAHGPYAAKGRR